MYKSRHSKHSVFDNGSAFSRDDRAERVAHNDALLDRRLDVPEDSQRAKRRDRAEENRTALERAKATEREQMLRQGRAQRKQRAHRHDETRRTVHNLHEADLEVAAMPLGTGAALTTQDLPLESRRARRRKGGFAGHTRHVRTTATRRDEEQPRLIKSNESSWDTVYGKGQGLRNPRDTGLLLESRRDVRRAHKNRTTRWALIGIAVIAFGLLCAGILWMQRSDAKGRKLADSAATEKVLKKDATTEKKVASGTASVAATGTDETVAGTITAEAAADGVTADTPTPQFATYKNIKLHLPVSVKALTEVAFHQASYSYARPMSTHMKFADLEKTKKAKSTGRDKSTQQYGPGALLVGKALRLWRSGRSGAASTAADCGAKPGSLVYAPVTGTVRTVCTYNLEGKVDDYEIHLTPDGSPHYEVVLIHLKSPYVKAGDRVVGGVTPIARVRRISAYLRNQLATYTTAKGDHTHVEINDITTTEYKAKHNADGTKKGQ